MKILWLRIAELLVVTVLPVVVDLVKNLIDSKIRNYEEKKLVLNG